jgi:Tol biopolymer transport system component
MKTKIKISAISALAALAGFSLIAQPKYSNWSEPVNLGPVINSPYNDQHPALSKDGLSLYITSNRPGGQGADDIWVSQRASVDDAWGPPQNLGPVINTAAVDFSPAFSRDGHWLFFNSNRPGGYGGFDIWVSYRVDVHDDFAWQTPINLGPGVNTSFDESGPTLFEDEETGITTLYFTSLNRPGGLGDWDIYASVVGPDGIFGPASLVVELSVPGTPATGRDTRTAIRHDGLEIIFTSNRPGGAGSGDLWVSTRATTLDPWSTPVNLGPPVNTASFEGAPALSSDAETLLFYSDRPGGFGGNDLYMTTRHKLSGKDAGPAASTTQ